MSSRKLTSGNSIRHRFTYTLITVVTSILLLFSIAIILYNTGTIEAKLEKRLEGVSNLAKSSLPSALWQFNYAYVSDFIDSIFLEDDLVFAKVLVARAVVKEKLRPGFPQKDFAWFRKSPGFIVKEIDIIYKGQPVGKIQLALSRQRIQKSIIINSVISIFLLAVIAAAISITIFFITRRYIFRPLSRLEGSAELISGGDLDASIDTSANDEIGNLARSFEQMIKNLNKITTSRNRLDNEVKERKQAEGALKEREFLFSQLFEQSTTSMCLYNPDGSVNRVNDEFCKMFGVEEKGIIDAGYNVFKDQAAIDSGIIPLLREIFEEKNTKHWEINFDIDMASDSTGTPTSKTGKIFIEVFGYPVLNLEGNLEYVVLQHYDITDRKRAEEALEDSEALLAQTGRMAKVGGWAIDTKTLEVTWTEETYRIHEVPLGHKPPLEEAINFFHSDDRPKLETAIKKALEQGEPYDMEARFITANGKQLWTHTICKPIIVEGKTVKLTGTFQDITARKHAEEKLRNSEGLFRLVTQTAEIGITNTDLISGKVVWDETCYKIHGYKPGTLINLDYYLDKIIHPDEKVRTLSDYRSALASKY